MTKKYIHQKKGHTCVLVAFLNYHIARYGRSPIKYDSKEFHKLFRRCLGTNDRGLLDYEPALLELNLKLVSLPKFSSVKHFRIHIIRLLKNGEIIFFPIFQKSGNSHAVILVNFYLYDEKTFGILENDSDDGLDLFETVNGSHEFSMWSDLTNGLFPDEGNPDNVRIFNSREGCSILAKYCIEDTKIIRTRPHKIKTKSNHNE